MLWMGVDVGTGGTRALLLNHAGEVMASASATHAPISMPQPLWAEQDARDWWRAAQQAIGAALRQAKIEGGEVAAVGLTGQMHGVVLLDAAGEVLGPSLIWCDQRTQPQVEELNRRAGPERVLGYIANPLLTGFSAPKILWEQQHRPEEFRRARKFLLPKDYVRYRLTGDFASDVSDASGTGLFDVLARRWSEPMLAALELKPEFVPRVFESTAVTGTISAAAAATTGLLAGTPVVAGGGDQAAGAVGNGIVAAGLASATLGSSGVLFAATDRPLADARGRIHTFCHAVPGEWHVMGVTQAAGLSLRWVRDQLGEREMQREAEGVDAYEALCQLAEQAPAGSDGLFFLPYLMGERAPHLDPQARGGWIGLTASHTRAHLVRAVLEGVAYSLRDSLEIFRELGIPVSEIRLSGGGARGRLWPQIQADIYHARCVRLASQEGAAYGAALLAMMGSGAYADLRAACQHCLRVVTRLEPEPARAALYDAGYALYRELYPRLQGWYPRLRAGAARPAGE